MASGAEVISTKFFHAFGYHVAENYLATFRPEDLQVAPDATMKDEDGRGRRLTREDLDAILERAARAGRRQLPRARQPQHRRPAARTVPLLRHASRRSQRHRPARTPPRAARPVGLRRLAESRRGPELELARQRRRRRQPADRPPPPARFRLDARQRQHQGAEPPRRQRVRVGVAADADHDADARALRAARGSRCRIRIFRRSGGSSRPTSARRTGSPTTRTRRSAMRGPTIASGRRASSRPSTTKRWPRVVRSAKFTDPERHRVPHQDAAGAADQGAQRVAERHQPGRRSRAQRGG